MKTNWAGSLEPKFAALLAGLLVWVITLTFDALEHKQALRDQHYVALETLAKFNQQLSAEIHAVRTQSKTLALNPTYFKQLASQLCQQHPYVQHIAIFHGNTLSEVYPAHLAQSAIDAHQAPSLLTENTSLTIGPYAPQQVAVLHIQTSMAVHGQTQTQNHLVDMQLDFAQLLISAGRLQLEQHYSLAIRDAAGQVIYGKAGLWDDNPVKQSLEMSNGILEFAIRPTGDWQHNNAAVIWWGSSLSMLAILFAYALSQHLRQRREREYKLNQSQYQLTEQSIELINQNTVLEMIVHHAPLPDVLLLITRLVEMHDPELLCAIMLCNPERTHLQHGAAPRLPDFFNRSLNGLPIAEGAGACGTAVYRGERVIIENIMTHPYWQQGRLLAQQANVKACWSQPIKDYTGKVLGAFALYHHTPCTPSEREIEIINSYTALAALAIESHHNAESLYLHDAALNVAADAIVITDLEARVIWANEACIKLTGYDLAEMQGHHCQSITQTAEDDPAYYEKLKQTVLAGHVWQGELVSQRKDGSFYHCELNITPIRDTHETITNFVAVKRDVTSRKNHEEQLRTLAFYDPLTKLPNRRLLIDRLGQSLVVSKRSGHYGALMFMDLDNFKPLNDERGHDVGDLLLIETANRITGCIRAEDTVARFGGDEFVVILEDLSEDKNISAAYAQSIAEKIRAALNQIYQLSVFDDQQQEVTISHHCTSSIGIVLFYGHESNKNAILKCADIAMYQAKNSGRDKICFYDME